LGPLAASSEAVWAAVAGGAGCAAAADSSCFDSFRLASAVFNVDNALLMAF
jgi:hypothetical protein